MKKIMIFVFLFLLAWVSELQGADMPSVLFLGEDFPVEESGYIEKKVASDLSVLNISLAEDISYRHISSLDEAYKILQAGISQFRAIVVQSDDVENNKKICRKICRLAEYHDADLLWMTSDGGYISSLGADYADYEGFCSGLNKEDRKSRIAYISDAIAQWWTGIAKGNQGIERVNLWDKEIPYYEYSGPEYINSRARIDRISEPELEVFLPHQVSKAPVVVFFPGGGLSFTGFVRNAREAAELLIPHGVAVVGVKYRVKRGLDIALEDARQAVRMVRENAEKWNIDPRAVGVAGQSAGALIVLSLASSYNDDASARPDYAIPLTSWYYGKHEWPFDFNEDTPPFFMRHATNDSGYRLALSVKEKLEKAGVPLDWKAVDDGGHGAFEITIDGYGHGWTTELLAWMGKNGILKQTDK